jgi:hypothetical protein
VAYHSLKRVRERQSNMHHNRTTVGWCLLAALGHLIVANDSSDAQAIVSEDTLTAADFAARDQHESAS